MKMYHNCVVEYLYMCTVITVDIPSQKLVSTATVPPKLLNKNIQKQLWGEHHTAHNGVRKCQNVVAILGEPLKGRHGRCRPFLRCTNGAL